MAGKEKEVSVIMVYYCAVNAFTKRATVEIDRETEVRNGEWGREKERVNKT